MRWDDLFSAGSVVSLNVSIWGARARITAADLGIDDSPEVRAALTLGTHRLVDPNTLAPIQNAREAARRVLNDHSVAFSFLKGAGARFVPDRNLVSLQRQLAGRQQAFNEEVTKFVARYADAKEQQLPVLREALRRAAHTPEAAENAIKRIEQEYPSAEKVRQSFGMSVTECAITAPRGAAAANALVQEGENVRSVVADMIAEARKQMIERTDQLIALMLQGGKVPVRSIEPTRALLARLSNLNIANDRELDAQIAKVRAFLDRAEQGGSVETAGFEEVKAALSGSIDDAIREAEAALSTVGKRKFSLMEGVA